MNHLRLSALGLLITGAFCAHSQPGTLDPSFANSGIAVIQPSTGVDNGWEVVPLEDTTMLVCGTTRRNNKPSAFVTRLLQDGTIDATYGITGGYTYFNSAQETYTYGMVVANDGSAYLAGLAYPSTTPTAVLIHVLPDGTPDPAFGTGGQVFYSFNGLSTEVQDIALQDDGKLVLAGRIGNGSTSNGLLLRFNPDGTVDNTFATLGGLAITAYNTADQLYDVAVLDDGSIVAAGVVTIGSTERTMVVKCNGSGVLDTSFGTAGTGATVPALPYTVHKAWGIEADGQRFYLAGDDQSNNTNYNAYVARMLDDGTLDGTFGTGGNVVVDLNGYDTGLDIAVQNDGKVLLSGSSGILGFLADRDFMVVRFTDAGVPDATFGTNGAVTTAVTSSWEDARSVAIQPDGKVVLTGVVVGTTNDVGVTRYLNDITTTVDEPLITNALLLYPNPASDLVRIKANGTGSVKVSLLDATGRLVREANIAAGSDVVLDLQGLEPGPYLVRSASNGGTAATRLVIAH